MEMECVCGEVLRGKLDDMGSYVKGSMAAEYEEHMKRLDHKASPEQWFEAGKRIAVWKERAK